MPVINIVHCRLLESCRVVFAENPVPQTKKRAPIFHTYLQVLGGMLTGREEALPQDMLPVVAARLLDVLAAHCSAGALPVDRPFSRYFYTLLRTLQAAVRQVCLGPHMPRNSEAPES